MNAQGEPGSMGKGHVLSLASIVWGRRGGGDRPGHSDESYEVAWNISWRRDIDARRFSPEYVKHLEGEEALQACGGSKVVNVELVLYEWMGCTVKFAYGLGITGN